MKKIHFLKKIISTFSFQNAFNATQPHAPRRDFYLTLTKLYVFIPRSPRQTLLFINNVYHALNLLISFNIIFLACFRFCLSSYYFSNSLFMPRARYLETFSWKLRLICLTRGPTEERYYSKLEF